LVELFKLSCILYSSGWDEKTLVKLLDFEWCNATNTLYVIILFIQKAVIIWQNLTTLCIFFVVGGRICKMTSIICEFAFYFRML